MEYKHAMDYESQKNEVNYQLLMPTSNSTRVDYSYLGRNFDARSRHNLFVRLDVPVSNFQFLIIKHEKQTILSRLLLECYSSVTGVLVSLF